MVHVWQAFEKFAILAPPALLQPESSASSIIKSQLIMFILPAVSFCLTTRLLNAQVKEKAQNSRSSVCRSNCLPASRWHRRCEPQTSLRCSRLASSSVQALVRGPNATSVLHRASALCNSPSSLSDARARLFPHPSLGVGFSRCAVLCCAYNVCVQQSRLLSRPSSLLYVSELLARR